MLTASCLFYHSPSFEKNRFCALWKKAVLLISIMLIITLPFLHLFNIQTDICSFPSFYFDARTYILFAWLLLNFFSHQQVRCRRYSEWLSPGLSSLLCRWFINLHQVLLSLPCKLHVHNLETDFTPLPFIFLAVSASLKLTLWPPLF